MKTRLFFLVLCILIGVIAHPERPPIPDDPNARHLFQLADMNRTADGYLTEAEVDDIFTQFDIDGDNRVNGAEFVKHWTDLNLGQNVSALVLFTRADTDGDGYISRSPDMGRIFYYFDRDGDHKGEFKEIRAHCCGNTSLYILHGTISDVLPDKASIITVENTAVQIALNTTNLSKPNCIIFLDSFSQ